METTYTPVGRNWKERLVGLLHGATRELVISSPYISERGIRFVIENMSKSSGQHVEINILTDLSPSVIAQGANDPNAVLRLAEAFGGSNVFHLPRLHAKVYISDSSKAIITSGNLTTGGLERNLEYGLEISGFEAVNPIREDVVDFAELGALFKTQDLRLYAKNSESVRQAYQEAQASIEEGAKNRLESSLRQIGDELIRKQVRGGPVHRVFARTILFLLNRQGPLGTRSLHVYIQNIHPELCDDRVDRVIDGEHYGKKWKHQVRSAQVHLKRRGLIDLRDGKWYLSTNR